MMPPRKSKAPLTKQHALPSCALVLRVDISFKESKPGADDVQGLLAAWWPKPFSTDRAAFLQQASAAPALDFSTLGTCLSSSIAQGVGVDPSTLQLYHATLADTPDWFKVRQTAAVSISIEGACCYSSSCTL